MFNGRGLVIGVWDIGIEIQLNVDGWFEVKVGLDCCSVEKWYIE